MSETPEAEALLEEFAALDRASAEEHLDSFVNDLRQAIASLRQRQEETEKERDKALAELKFYGDPATYKGLIADNANLESQLQQAETALRRVEELNGGYPDDYCSIARDYFAANPAPPPNPKDDK